MKHPLIFLSASLISLSMSLKGQTNFLPGYYITLQSDTVYGEIDMRGDQRNCHMCTFRLREGEEFLTFEPGEILAYRFFGGGKYYISREVLINNESQEVFLEFLVNGISNLYFYRGEGSGRYYLESTDGLLMELTNNLIESEVDGVAYTRESNRYVGQMKATFSDCHEIQSKLDRAKFSHQSLIELTSEYHDYVCEDDLCIIYEKRVPAVQVSGGPYAGIIRSSLDFPAYNGTEQDFNSDASYKWYHYYTFSKHTDLVLGLRLSFTFPRGNEKLAWILLTEYTRGEYSAYTEDQTNQGLLTQMEARAHLSSMNLLTGIQYAYPKGKLRPTLAIGPLFSVDLNSYFDIQHTLITGSLEIIQDYQTAPIGGLIMGGFSQVGVDWSMAERHHLGCNLRYHLTRQRTTHYVHRDGIAFSLYYNYRLTPGHV